MTRSVTDTPAPTPEEQLTFLAKLQRVFAEGDFAATYKFALLISLADLAVEVGSDDGRELTLSNCQIAEKFIYLYWRQAVDYGTGRAGAAPGVLVQNRGAQAAVVAAIARFRSTHSAPTPQHARTMSDYSLLLSSVTQTVSAQPLNYLQNFGGVTDEFIYERFGRGMVRLKRGVGYSLRRFHPLIQQLARSHWVGHIKGNRRNYPILGDTGDDLEEFLFATPRQSLLLLAIGLRKVDGPRCFYCGDGLSTTDVDHFVPFAQYPRDLAHNFVLAHPSCNRSKSDTLAARPHLERWLERLDQRDESLSEIGRAAGLIADAKVTRRVAAWGYTSAMASGGRAWLAPNLYEPIDPGYKAYFLGQGAVSTATMSSDEDFPPTSR
jgi:5-methylcytosine-specific restriction endonuclease McrA